ncbi:MAG: family oxidoreductase [Noviherbaspirillum sp.]|nr:family oxidoreductase [Noviherbaspirillum sp.]
MPADFRQISVNRGRVYGLLCIASGNFDAVKAEMQVGNTDTRTGELAGKAALVTGGASGLGAAICRLLSASGADVMVGDLNCGKAVDLARDIGPADKPNAIAFDVGDPAAAQYAIDATISRFGHLDILVNNAGTDVTCSLEQLSPADWDRVMRTNLYGPFLLSKHASRYMKEHGGGQIVNIASTAAKRAWPNACAYHASKWGLLGLSHAMHAELRPHGVKVTAVLAGGMRTPFLLDRFPDIDISTLQDPASVALTVKMVLTLPDETVVPEIMVLPMGETSWP